MIEIEIPKDIRKYESKLIGPLTTRQTVCAVFACGISVLIYTSLKEVPSDIRFILITIFITPFLLLGWVKPYGMKFEHFAMTTFSSYFLSPKHRKYKTENFYDIKVVKKQNKKKRKINKDFLPYK